MIEDRIENVIQRTESGLLSHTSWEKDVRQMQNTELLVVVGNIRDFIPTE